MGARGEGAEHAAVLSADDVVAGVTRDADHVDDREMRHRPERPLVVREQWEDADGGPTCEGARSSRAEAYERVRAEDGCDERSRVFDDGGEPRQQPGKRSRCGRQPVAPEQGERPDGERGRESVRKEERCEGQQ